MLFTFAYTYTQVQDGFNYLQLHSKSTLDPSFKVLEKNSLVE